MQGQFFLNKIAVFIIAVGSVLLLAGCAAGPKINTDYDRNVNFDKYKTYGFYSPLGIENPNYTSIYGSIFREVISEEMERRGYTKSDTPDLLINVSGRLKEKTKVTTTTDPYMGSYYYRYRRGYYGTWGDYGFGTQTYVSSYTEGTVNIDLVDSAEKRMVWEGVAVGRVQEDNPIQEVRTNIQSAIKDMFSAYPFRAGQD